MIQTSVAAPVPTREQPDTQENELLDPLWRLAGDMGNARALIVAEHGLDLMCGLIRRGCLAATVLHPSVKPDANDYDVVFVPQVSALSSLDQVIRLARRSLAPNGRLIAGVRDGRAAAALVRRLQLNGFATMQSIHLHGDQPGNLPEGMLLRADLRRPS